MKKPTVLIADDHGLVAEGIARIVSARYEVVGMVADGRALIEQARALSPDLITLDIGMPVVNGIQAARELALDKPRRRLVFVTQQLEVPYLRAAFQTGAKAFVAKQSAGHELLEALNLVLEGRRYITPLLREHTEHVEYAFESRMQGEATARLTPRQKEVLQAIVDGHTSKEIAARMYVSVKTVEFHRSALLNELGLRNATELVRYALNHPELFSS